jgi:hypothetical protein
MWRLNKVQMVQNLYQIKIKKAGFKKKLKQLVLVLFFIRNFSVNWILLSNFGVLLNIILGNIAAIQ